MDGFLRVMDVDMDVDVDVDEDEDEENGGPRRGSLDWIPSFCLGGKEELK